MLRVDIPMLRVDIPGVTKVDIPGVTRVDIPGVTRVDIPMLRVDNLASQWLIPVVSSGLMAPGTMMVDTWCHGSCYSNKVSLINGRYI